MILWYLPQNLCLIGVYLAFQSLVTVLFTCIYNLAMPAFNNFYQNDMLFDLLLASINKENILSVLLNQALNIYSYSTVNATLS